MRTDTPQTILVVDDERDIVELLNYNLEKEGFDTISAYDGEDALKKLSDQIDLVILDVMMPKLNGLEVCKKIRNNRLFNHIPILLLTARDSEIDEIIGLELGADDYITKPVSPRKLIARVHSILRRLSGPNPAVADNTRTFGKLVISIDEFKVTLNGELLKLTKTEFDILTTLTKIPEKVYSRDELLVRIWGEDVFITDRVIDVHIRKLREKLGGYAKTIDTVRGVGYVFRIDGAV